MTHIDLYSGIGGFALAAKWCWGDKYMNVAHVEIEKYPCAVYHKHFHESRCLGDIRQIGWYWYISRGWARNIDLLTGGVPCQPVSVAGKRRGKEDDRWLWPETIRAVKELRPRWCVFENPPGFISHDGGVEFDKVLSALEDEEYETASFVIPACGKNAPHRRDRIWIIAYSRRPYGKGITADTKEQGLEGGDTERPGRAGRRHTEHADGFGWNDKGEPEWETPWPEVAARLCRVSPGLPSWMVGHRVPRLKALGNAVVPQIAYEVFCAIRKLSA